MLTNMGYDSMVVGDSAKALSAFKKGIKTGKRFDIVIADNALEDISGLELASRMRPLDPEANFILISGWGPDPDPAQIEKIGIGITLKKPFRIEQLSEAIARATGTAPQ
jgi:DNA-binding NtrC family response regulator